VPVADLAVALDLPSGEAALRLVDRCGDAMTWVKVGPVLFVREGPGLVKSLLERGKRVFLDLKWHDIPSTVAGAVAAAADLGVELATVHCAGGPAMLEAAAGAGSGPPRLVGVGIVTSMEAAEYSRIAGKPVGDLVTEQERLISLARDAGLAGFVCAVPEVERLRGVWGKGALVVTPGIRAPDEEPGDQRRTASAAAAVAAGSDLLVVGRPISGARDPAAAIRALRSSFGPHGPLA
jgi:orotidine-5'-phosphate decarboxylase